MLLVSKSGFHFKTESDDIVCWLDVTDDIFGLAQISDLVYYCFTRCKQQVKHEQTFCYFT